ncbi:MAG: ATP synthase F1 subunit delta [Bacteroidetes bacterium]|nr:ATP synthase F1 subunit delta [Bacteroidota bacterium]
MSIIRLSTRYAKSLLSFAIEQGNVDDLHKDAELLIMEIDKSEDLSSLLKSPIIKGEEKMKILISLFGDRVTATMQIFLQTVIDKRREFYLKEMCLQYLVLYNKHKNIVKAKLTTAVEIDNTIIDQVIELVKSKTNKKVELSKEIDGSLVGGFILEYEDYLYDASIAHQLHLLKQEFRDNEYIKKF